MSDRVFSVDKFLGINEYADSETELKPGQASGILNFNITDGGNLTLRPGVSRYRPVPETSDYFVGTDNTRMVQVYIDGIRFLLWWGESYVLRGYCPESGKYVAAQFFEKERIVHVLQTGANVYVVLYNEFFDEVRTPRLYVRESGFLDYEYIGGGYAYRPYIPLIITGAAASGGGAEMEPLNILTNKFRVQFIAEENVKDYVLPSITDRVHGFHVGGNVLSVKDAGTYNSETHTFTLSGDPMPGSELVFVCSTVDADLSEARQRFLKMRFHEAYNGATDTRLFFYGDGSNLCYYTGVPAFDADNGYGDAPLSDAVYDGTNAKPSLYLPAGNELAVDFSDSAVTGLVRHYSRLLAFKPDGVDAITYEPVTLADGSVIAGFFLRPVSRDFGNDAMGQVQLVDNAARSLSKNGVYDWRISAGNYRDERYAKRVSDAVSKTLAAADTTKIITCDDGITKTWYAFLNDGAGTVLVHRYDLDVWSIYRSSMFEGVTFAYLFDKKVIFLRGGDIFFLDQSSSTDAGETASAEPIPIEAVWESGFQDFGASYRRKDSAQLWVSMLPESGARLHVSVQTDSRQDYEERILDPKEAAQYGDAEPESTPFVMRLRMKIKRFVYYKLILRVTDPGAKATVLGYDQHIRFSSNVK